MGFENLRFMCGVKYKEYIYASSHQFNGLFRINCETGEHTFIGSFPNEALSCETLHRNAILIGQKIFFVPYKARNMHVYDIFDRKFYIIALKRRNYANGYIGEKIGGNIYLIPENPGEDFAWVDCQKGTIKTIMNWEKFEKIVGVEIKNTIAFCRICAMGTSIFLPLYNSNIIFEICVSDGKVVTHKLEQIAVWGCFRGKNGIWVLGNEGNKLYFWNKKENYIKKINCSLLEQRNKRNINWILDIGDDVYALPAWGDNIWKLKNDQLVKSGLYEMKSCILPQFYAPIEENETFYLLPMGQTDLLRIENGKIKRIHIKKIDNNSELYQKIMQANLQNAQDDVWNENIKFSLEQYIDLLMGNKF